MVDSFEFSAVSPYLAAILSLVVLWQYYYSVVSNIGNTGMFEE